jgi:hypothetical protein
MASKDNKHKYVDDHWEEEEAEESTASTKKQRTDDDDDNSDSLSTDDFSSEPKEEVSSEEGMNLRWPRSDDEVTSNLENDSIGKWRWHLWRRSDTDRSDDEEDQLISCSCSINRRTD